MRSGILYYRIVKWLAITLLLPAGLLIVALTASGFMRFTPPEIMMPEPSFNHCHIINVTFQAGEELVYKVYYNWNFVWLSAGEVVFTVTDLGQHYHLVAVGRTFRTYEWFFKVRDRYESIIDKKTLLPVEHIRDVHEGSFTLYDHLRFDQKAGRVTSFRGKTKDVAVMREFEVDQCVHDMVSILYFVRNIDPAYFARQREVPVSIFLDNRVYNLMVRHRGTERISLRRGSEVSTMKYSPELIAGDVFSEGAEMIVYTTDDLNRIPVMIESPVSVGSVKAVLQSHRGLKYRTSLLQ